MIHCCCFFCCCCCPEPAKQSVQMLAHVLRPECCCCCCLLLHAPAAAAHLLLAAASIRPCPSQSCGCWVLSAAASTAAPTRGVGFRPLTRPCGCWVLCDGDGSSGLDVSQHLGGDARQEVRDHHAHCIGRGSSSSSSSSGLCMTQSMQQAATCITHAFLRKGRKERTTNTQLHTLCLTVSDGTSRVNTGSAPC
jgi:hypothetical protein